MKRVHVAAAVIRGSDGRVLIARRPEDKHQGGLWEFPGGKVEDGEPVRAALARELEEELGIRVERARPLIQVREAHGAEGQPLAWVEPRELADYEFPAANAPIVQAARLPAHYLITPDGLEPGELISGVRKAVEAGIRLIQLRAPNMFSPEYRDLAIDIQGLCAGKAQLMLKGPLEWLGDFPAAGWHLTSAQLRKYASAGRPFPEGRLLAASCHDAEELALAASMGVEFVTLSPVQPTESHPGEPALGWDKAAELIAGFNQPVYLLGGLGPQQAEQAWEHGAQGVAGIRAFWPGGL
ncbi:Nudix family hydrolase [Pseudomonas aeruginosa]|nr:Nudix family hydrolase [Pseudomonas aeruginosa]